MGKGPVLDDVGNILNGASTINSNNDKIETAFDNTLSRDGSTPNQMEADLDMNSNDVLNANSVEADALYVGGIQISSDNALLSASAEPFSDWNAASEDNISPNVDQIFVYSENQILRYARLPLGLSSTILETAPLTTNNGSVYWGPSGVTTVLHWGAVGDGVTDDTSSLVKSLAAADTNGWDIEFSAGTYEVTDNLPLLHDVCTSGIGKINRGVDTFHLNPKVGEINTLYVNASTGSDVNDGISPDYPLETIQRAMDILQAYAPLTGTWQVELAAGTYAPFVMSSLTTQEDAITIYGPAQPYMNGMATAGSASTITIADPPSPYDTDDAINGATVEIISGTGQGQSRTISDFVASTNVVTVSSAWSTQPDTTSRYVIYTEPTAIIEPDGDASADAMSFSDGARVIVDDVLIQDFTTGKGGVVQRGRLTWRNVHTRNTRESVSNITGASFAAFGGIWDGNSIANGTGYAGLYSAVHNLQQVSGEQLLIRNFDNRAVLVNEGAQGHIDNLILQDSGIGLVLKRGAGAVNTSGVVLERNAVGVEAGAPWFNNNVVFGSGADANTLKVTTYGPASELDNAEDNNLKMALSSTGSAPFGVISGTTSETDLVTFPQVRDWIISGGEDWFKVTMNIRRSTNVGTCLIKAVLDEDDTPLTDFLAQFTLAAGASESFIEMQGVWLSASSMRFVMKGQDNSGNLYLAQGGNTTSVLDKPSTLRITCTPSDSGDDCNLRQYVYQTSLV
jgi:hypothetical protein